MCGSRGPRRWFTRAASESTPQEQEAARAREEERLNRLLEGRLFAVWEENHLNRLLKHLKVDCVFDVGANEGQYAQMLREKSDYRGLIISFEPGPREAAKAREAAADDPLWIVEEVALSDHDGTQEFNIMTRPTFSSLSRPSHADTDLFVELNQVAQTVEVVTETLETALTRLRAEHGFERPFLKLDTQGFDVQIVTAGAACIQEFLGLQSELAIKRLYETSVDFRDALTTYQDLGFEISAFVPNNAGHFPLLVEADCIMVRSSEAQSAATSR